MKNAHTGAKQRILAWLADSTSPIGETSESIREATGVTVKCATTTIGRCIADGEMHAIGPCKTRRIFATQERMEACRAEAEAHLARELAEMFERRRQYERDRKARPERKAIKRVQDAARRERRSAERAARPKPAVSKPQAVKPKAPVRGPTPTLVRSDTVQIKRSKPKWVDLPVIVPPHVKVQVCPTFPDYRYAVDPSIAGRGVVTADWKERRLAEAKQ